MEKLKLMGEDTKDMNAKNKNTKGISSADLNAADLNAADLNAADLNAMDLNAEDMDAEAMDIENMTGFYKCLLEKRPEEAMEYKNKRIPSFIYKYFSFGNEGEKLYEMKLQTLKDNKIFFSAIENFNDPFEFKTAFIDAGSDGDSPEYYAAKLRYLMTCATIRIASFAEDGFDIPMWAYYADSFRGYCVKYEVLNKEKFFKVDYVDARFPSYMADSVLQSNDKTSFLRIASLFSTKYSGWSHENEIRAVVKRENYMTESMDGACSYSCGELGIRPVELVLGCSCSDRSRADVEMAVQEWNRRFGLHVKVRRMIRKEKEFGFRVE